VVGVRKQGDAVWHTLEVGGGGAAPATGTAVHGGIDWERCYQLMSTHMALAEAAEARNDADCCYSCKDALLKAAGPLADAEGATVVLSVNVDDLGDHRPGQRAAAERGAAFSWSTPVSPRPTCGKGRATWGSAPGTSRAVACLASACPTGRR
jgi:PP-loop superfamily ATP-utilizing enzyme